MCASRVMIPIRPIFISIISLSSMIRIQSASHSSKENAELRADFDSLMSVMKQMMSKLDTVDSRLAAIETALGITVEQRRTEPQAEKSVSPKEIERQDIDRAEVAERLDGIRNSIGSLRAILNK